MQILGENAGIRYEIFTMEDADALVEVDTEAFTTAEPMTIAQNISPAVFSQFMRLLVKKASDEALTILGRDLETGRVAGVMLNEDLATPPPENIEQAPEVFHPIFTFLGQMSEGYMKRYITWDLKEGQVAHFFMLATRIGFKGRGLGKNLLEYSLENARNRKYLRAVAEATGVISQHVFAKCGFQTLEEAAYRDFVYLGERIFENITEHPGTKLVEYRISDS